MKTKRHMDFDLLPQPRELKPSGAVCSLGSRPVLAHAGEGSRFAAERLADLLCAEWHVPVGLLPAPSADRPALGLGRDAAGALRALAAAPGPPAAQAEGYRLDAGPGGVALAGGSERGLLWGAMTLRQLARREGRDLSVPGVRIADCPRYPWRGFMIDSGRAPNSLAKLRRIIRICSAFKLNLLLFREGDDEMNAVRYATNRLGTENPHALSIEEIAELAGYAARYGISLIPEIESLGHSAAKGRCYRGLVAGGIKTRYEGIGVHVRKRHLLPNDPRTLALLKSMYAEWLAAVRPPLIHLGLDEVRLPGDVQAAHLAAVLPQLFACAREAGVDSDAVVWSDAPPTPRAYRSRVVRCLWGYADGKGVGPQNPHLVNQGILKLAKPHCRERVLMAGGSSSGHTPTGKSAYRDAYRNLAEWACWGDPLANVIGLLAVQWSANLTDLWLPDFVAAADYGWRPPKRLPIDDDAVARRIRAHLARIRDAAHPAPSEVDPPAWDGIWLKDGNWLKEIRRLPVGGRGRTGNKKGNG